MASPFTKFRKYQKAGLAVLGVLCMISFIFSDFSCLLGSNYRDDTVATSRYGTITDLNVSSFLQSRKAANGFVYHLTLSPPYYEVEDYFGPYDEEDVVRTHLLAKKAEEMGIVVSDQAINDFMESMSFDSDEDTRRTRIERAMEQSGYNPTALSAALRTELAAQQVKDQLSPPLAFLHIKQRPRMVVQQEYFMSPGERWEYYQRLHRRVTVEALELPVADFFAAVPEPTEDELLDYFKRYESRYAQPDSPEPGFKLAHLASFEHFAANYDAFLEQAKKALTPQDVEKYYNENKDKFGYGGLPTGPDGRAPEDDPTAELPSFDLRPIQGPHPFFSRTPVAPFGSPGEAPGSAFGPGRVDDKSPTFPFGNPEGAKDKPATPPTTTPPTTTPPTSSPPASKDDGKSSNPAKPPEKNAEGADCDRPGAAPERTFDVALADPAQKEGSQKTDGAATSQKSEPPATTQPDKSAPDKTIPDQSSPDKTAQDTTTQGTSPSGGAAAAADDKKKEDELPSLKVLLAQFRVRRSVAEGLNPEHAPFWSVENVARDAAARQRAIKLIDEALAPLRKQMEEYQLKHQQFVGSAETQAPPRPVLAKLASPGITFHAATPMLTYRELAEGSVLGKLYPVDERSFPPRPFRNKAYRELSLFEPVVVESYESQDRYLVWKVDERRSKRPESMTEEYVPGGPTVREMVVRAWKLEQARPQALARAAQLAEQARQSGKPLTQISEGGRSGAKLPPFTWMSETDGQISKVEGLDVPGDELMRAIYQLKTGAVAAAMNAPQTAAYVVKLVDFDYVSRGVGYDERSIQTFFISMSAQEIQPVVLHERRRQEDRWFRTIEAEADLKWIRQPQIVDND
ncbi:MAG: SurA N-terminal domain-containing protein [Planctomycetia bacterium]|nr:SurA N-terminal domain-containing protein [Planctomycetia bacterium]